MMAFPTTKKPYSDSSVFGPRDQRPIDAVALAPVNDSYYADATLEPPMVRIRAQNNAYLYGSSNNIHAKGSNTNNAIISNPGEGVLTSRIKRIGITYLRLQYLQPSVGKDNGELFVYQSSTKTITRVGLNPLVPGSFSNYSFNTPQKLCILFNAAVTGAGIAGLSATLLSPTESPNIIVITATTPMLFLSQSTAVRYGISSFGFANVNTPLWDGYVDGSGMIAPDLAAQYDALCFSYQHCVAQCLPTRWIDISSNTLTRYTKLQSSSTSETGSNFIYRLFLTPFEDYDSDPGTTLAVTPATVPKWQKFKNIYDSNIAIPITFTYDPNTGINAIDLEFRDMYGRLLSITGDIYIPNIAQPSFSLEASNWENGFSWDIGFAMEL